MTRYYINHNYFDVLSNDAAYIVGFLMADGNIGINDSGNYYIQMNLNDKDADIISFILDKLSPRPISRYTVIQSSGLQSKMARFKITSNQLCKQLISYGVIPRKTGYERIINIPSQFMSDYMRGLFDGDGCISKKKKGFSLTINSASKGMIEDIISYFGFGTLENGHGCYVYRVSNYEDMQKFKNIIYYSDNIFHMQRKKIIFDKVPNGMKYEAFGELKTLKDWSQDNRCIISYDGLKYRINHTNMTMEECLTLPKRSKLSDMYHRNKQLTRKHSRYK